MSHTFHHGAPPRPVLVKLPDHYSGWMFEGATRAPTRRWVKHLANKAYRRYSRKLTKWELFEALQEAPKFETDFDEQYDTLSEFYMEVWREEQEKAEHEAGSWDEYEYDPWDDDAYSRDYTHDYRF